MNNNLFREKKKVDISVPKHVYTNLSFNNYAPPGNLNHNQT
ncbi:protein of unknown function [Latilactobacillus sakei]|nr:protein of unknown function [Latilactobacillus sakei]